MSDEQNYQAGPGYALARWADALRSVREHPDPAVRTRASEKLRRWSAVLEGMADGSLRIGSRTPVAQTPAWVTLEVVHGGFATGRYMAEGELREHERLSLATLPKGTPGNTDRERLNLYFASDAGLEALRAALREGRYAIDVPEEAALMAIAWLLDNGQATLAFGLLDELRPLMHRLRFYPRLDAPARTSGIGVHVASVDDVIQRLRAGKRATELECMNATLATWNPFYDELVALWLRTVEGEAPQFQHKGGELVRDEKGQPVAVGGWPCRVWPGDWPAAREQWLTRYDAALRELGPSGRHHRPKSNFQLLLRLLQQCPNDTSELSPGGMAAIRRGLASAIYRHGVPGQASAIALRNEQVRIARRPLHRDVADLLVERLDKLPHDAGIPTLDAVVQAAAANEHPKLPAGTRVPERLLAKVERALLAPVAELVERGIIGSAEVLALVLPQLTAQIAAAGLDDPQARDLFARTYVAFRQRRSLLLLNLEHQVTLDELPWVSALQSFRCHDSSTARNARQSLRDVTLLAFEHFPHTIVPNPLLREMAALAKRADLELPFVEEIAADIFMGTFSKKFSDAAQIASKLLEGTLYARYYELPSPRTSLENSRRGTLSTRWGKATHPKFDTLCIRRSAEAGNEGGFVAKNGAILEQCQILTSYNLATLVQGLELFEELAGHGAHWASQALRWVVKQQSRLPHEPYPRLRAIKNCAYAWRQAIFFASFAPEDQQRATIDGLAEHTAATPPECRKRLTPALVGLRNVLDGAAFDDRGFEPEGGRRFLGWSCGHHWLDP